MSTAFRLLFTLALAASLLAAVPAFAADPAPGYLLGTTLVLSAPQQLKPPTPSGYWGDLLPVEYRFGLCYIVDAINAARAARGNSVPIDVTKWPINIGGEMNTDHGWEYTVDFQLMQPEDVQAALAAFPLSGPLSDLPTSFRAISTGYFYTDSQDESLVLDIYGTKLAIDMRDGMAAMREKLVADLQQIFGPDAKFDLGCNYYGPAFNGTPNFNVSVTVYIDGQQPSYGPYNGEGGM
jgi:hypothetical protein